MLFAKCRPYLLVIWDKHILSWLARTAVDGFPELEVLCTRQRCFQWKFHSIMYGYSGMWLRVASYPACSSGEHLLLSVSLLQNPTTSFQDAWCSQTCISNLLLVCRQAKAAEGYSLRSWLSFQKLHACQHKVADGQWLLNNTRLSQPSGFLQKIEPFGPGSEPEL